MNRARSFLIAGVAGLLACLSLSACYEEIIYMDFPVQFTDVGGSSEWLGEKEMVLGVYEEQLFRGLGDGDAVHIINGLQGGTWVHLSVRVTGLPRAGVINVVLGEDIGAIEYNIKLVRTAEGFLEAYDIPVPVPFEGDELEALFGQTVVLKVSFSAEGQSVSAESLVVLEQG